MAKFLDLNGLETFLTKVKDWVNTLVNSTKSSLQSSINNKVDKTTTVNGHPLNGNVTVTKSDVSLGNVTNDAQVKRSEMGVASGVATLGSDGKLTSAQLPAFKSVNGTSVVGSGTITIDLTLYKVVEELPKSGIDSTKIYLVKSAGSGESNIYTEYMYVNSKWEKLGEHKSDVDLTPYVKFTDVATSSKAGAMSSTDKAKLDGIASGANNYTHPTSSGNKHIPAGGSSGQILRWASDGTATWGNDNNTTYSAFKGATSSAAGGSGLVPAPAQGDNSSKYLKADGTWQTPPNTTYSNATSSTSGLMSSTDKAKLDGIASGANKTTVDTALSSTSTNPVQNKVINSALAGKANSSHTHTASQVSGLATVATSGSYNDLSNKPAAYSLPTASSTTKGGILIGFTESGKNYPVELDSSNKAFVNVPWTDTNTTYSNATSSTAGLMSSSDKSKLDGIASGANNYTHPTSSGNKHIPSGGSSGQILRWSADGTAVWGNDNNTTYSAFKGATSSAAGGSGLVPAPAKGDNSSKYLKADGTWATPPNTTYSTATSSTNGLMSSTDKAKLDGIASGATKITVDSSLSSTSTNPVQNKVINSALAGKAASSHNHDSSYVASVSVSGNNLVVNKNGTNTNITVPYATNAGNASTASSAAKLTTARQINGTNFDGSANITTTKWGNKRKITFNNFAETSVSLDGSGDVTCNWVPYSFKINIGNTNNYPYHRIATTGIVTGSYQDREITLLLSQGYIGGCQGVIRLALRTNGSSDSGSSVEAHWLYRKGFAVDDIQVGIFNTFGNTYADAFLKTRGSYASTTGVVLTQGTRGSLSAAWTLIDSDEEDNTTTSDDKNSTECFKSITDAGTALHDKAYSTIVTAKDGATVSAANQLVTSRTINGTSFNGSSNITTANWGTSRTLTIGNSGKSVNGSGNVSWSLSEIGAAASSHTHSISNITNLQSTLDGKAASSHTHAASQVTGLTASRALVSDSSGHPTVSAVTSTELGYLDGVTSSIQTQLNGKAASSHSHNAFGGATSSAAGSAGFVPAPAAGNQSKYLRGDGTWQVPTNTVYTHPTSPGNKHIPSGGSSGQILRWSADGTAVWGNDNNTTYSAGTGLSLSGTTFNLDQATSSERGGIKIGFPKSDKNYPVVLNENGQAYVNVPWTDTNTVYTHPSYTSRSSGLYKITVDSTGHVSAATAVSKSDITALGIPGSDTNTTYSIATASTAGLVKPVSVITKPTLQSVTTTAGRYYQVQMSSDGNMFVNVPWTDTNTVYSLPLAASGTRGGIKIGYASTTNNRAVQLISEKAYVNIPTATSSITGLMSSTLVSKLNGIASGATADSAIPTSVINALS